MKKHLLYFYLTLTLLGFSISAMGAEKPTFYGSLLNGPGFQNPGSYGIYSLSDPYSELVNCAKNTKYSFWDGVQIDGIYHGFGFYSPTSSTQAYRLMSIDVETWEQVGDDIPVATGVGSLAYDVTTGNTYYLTSGKEFGTLNLKTGVMLKIGNVVIGTAAIFPSSLAADSKGQIYLIASDSKFYKVNKTDATLTLVGSLGISIYSGGYGAVFDHATDKLYIWPMVNATNFPSGMYEVDTTTGAATLISSKFENRVQLSAIFLKDPLPVATAPAKATDLTFTPSAAGSLNGKVSFTIPNKAFDGSDLAETVDAKILIGTQEAIVLTGLNTGYTYTSSDITLPTGGQIAVRVILFNANGESQIARYSFWAGKDFPLPVSDLLLVKDEFTSNPKITWTAPTQTVNGGFFDFASLKYKVVRMPDNVVVADANATTEFIDITIPDRMEYYSYAVSSYIDYLEGKSVTSNEVLFGKPFDVPFTDAITAQTFKVWTNLDINSDNKNWTFATNAISPSADKIDDWFLSPPVTLKSGVAYKLSYYAKSGSNGRALENLEITYGKSATPESQNVIGQYLKFIDKVGTIKSERIVIPTAETDAPYYLGFHVSGQANNFAQVNIKDVKIEVLAEKGTPAPVTDLNIAYGTVGALTSTITFKAPTTAVGGEALENAITSIEIYRNAEVVPLKILTSPIALGELLSWEDTTPIAGMNTYRIVAYNALGAGLDVSGSVFVGQDKPVAVSDITLVKNEDGSALLNWTAPTQSINNGYLNEASLTYKLTRNIGATAAVVVESLTATNYTDETIDKVNQDLVSYTITAVSAGGEGNSLTSDIVRFGSAYKLPYAESFATAKSTKAGWVFNAPDASSTWSIASKNSGTTPAIAPVDADGGMLLCPARMLSSVKKSMAVTPVLDASTVENPLLKFSLFHTKGAVVYGQYLYVLASVDGGEFEKIKSDSILIELHNDGWTNYEIPMPKYKGIENLRIGFDASARATGGYNFAIDNIRVDNQYDKELNLIAFDSLLHTVAGKTNDFTVKILNSGATVTSDYTVKLFKDNVEYLTQNGVSVESGDTVNFVFAVPFELSEIGKTYQFRAEVEIEGDGDLTNNSSRILNIPIESPFVLTAQNLEGEEIQDNNVQLIWTAPVEPKNPVDVFDGFEAYEKFIIDNIGDWTMYDGDGIPTYVNKDQFLTPYPNKEAAMAFQVFNQRGAVSLSEWSARTGEHSLASFPRSDAKENNDWAISPLLCGATQTITFYAKGILENNEKFNFYYSTTDKNPESFVKLTNNVVLVPNVWKQYEFAVPAGAKYFAIQCVSQAAITLMIDDVRYIAPGEDINVMGYNIYRNGEKINKELVSASTFIDENPMNGVNDYKVTVVYAEGESDYSNKVILNIETGLNSIYSNVKITSENGYINIKGASELPISVMAINGIIIAKNAGEEYVSIPVQNGIYLVKVGNFVTKVIVK